LVFGSANATTTHPYYLVGVAIPLAAVIGIGASVLWRAFLAGGLISWIIIGALAAGAGYQICGARGEVGEWSIGLVIGAVLFSAVVLLVGIRRGLQASPLARIAFIAGAASLLLIPAAASVAAGGRIAGPPGGINAAGRGSVREPGSDREATLIRFLEQEEARVGEATLFAVNARDAAPFIIRGVRAIAIGGFSGNDPVLTVASFREAATNGSHYFLMPLSRQGSQGASLDQGRQQAIIEYVLRSWHDVSRQAELPRGSVYGKPAI
jgi:4-amino-4-deoxy-L-arabinose transferase-like glycosyltransferase